MRVRGGWNIITEGWNIIAPPFKRQPPPGGGRGGANAQREVMERLDVISLILVGVLPPSHRSVPPSRLRAAASARLLSQCGKQAWIFHCDALLIDGLRECRIPVESQGGGGRWGYPAACTQRGNVRDQHDHYFV